MIEFKTWHETLAAAWGIDKFEKCEPAVAMALARFLLVEWDRAVTVSHHGNPVQIALTLTMVQARGTELLLENRTLQAQLTEATHLVEKFLASSPEGPVPVDLHEAAASFCQKRGL